MCLLCRVDEIVDRGRAEFGRLIQTFNGCLAQLHETYRECLDTKEAYALETDADVAALETFVLSARGVMDDIRDDAEALENKLALLTMGHDQEELSAVLQMQRAFRARGRRPCHML